MCLPDFIHFKQINEENALIGYRTWRVYMNNLTILVSEIIDYEWPIKEYKHEVKELNSGIYAYNYYNNYKYNNYNNYYDYYNNYNYNNYNNYYNNYYNYYYNVMGIIKQFGRVAIHKVGQRSEICKIDTLFSIRESDAKGPNKFLDWIGEFNLIINNLAKTYNVPNVVSWQDFLEQQEKKK